MVLTRSHRKTSKSINSPKNSASFIQDAKSESKPKKIRKRATTKPIPSTVTDESDGGPLPDSTTPPPPVDAEPASVHLVKDGVIVMTTGDDADASKTDDAAASKSKTDDATTTTPDGKKRRKGKNRKRRNAGSTTTQPTEQGSKTTDLTICISSSTTPPDMPDEKPQVEHQITSNEKENLIASKQKPLQEPEELEPAPEPKEKEAAEAVPAIDFKKVAQLYKKESFSSHISGQQAKQKGKPKSGRKWKTEQLTRFSGMKQDKPLRTSWETKMQQRAELKSLKKFEAEIKEAKNEEIERKKKFRAKKMKRKFENQRKSEIVQVIKNPAKIKRMKKKQLRKIEHRAMPDFNKAQIFA